MEVDNFLNFTNRIEEFTKKPEKYLSLQEARAEEIKHLTEDLYNFTKKNEQKHNAETLSRLVVKNLDEEQIWQQIELQNNFICDKLVSDIAHLLAKKELTFFVKSENNAKRVCLDEDIQEEKMSDVEIKEEKVEQKSRIKRKKGKPSIVDDKFFKLYEMEEFLERVEKGEDDDNDEEIDYFEGSEHSEVEDRIHYNDFFDQPDDEVLVENDREVKFDVSEEEDENEDLEEEEENDNDYDNEGIEEEEEEEEDDDDDDVNGNEDVEEDIEDEKDSINNQSEDKTTKQPSTHEARQERLKSRIKALEKAALKEKPWQLKGEVTADSRPQNSLLEEYVEFDIATRPAPVLTEKSTLKLEDIILQRIKDKAWDDVVRKIKPTEIDREYRKKLVLDQEKSKLSLAQIYEQEYLNQLDKKNESVVDKPEVEAPEHKEIRIMMNKLFSKLDALSNFHFTPNQVKEDVKIISNIPAINMEEVAPVATSDAALLAPEEIKPKSKGELIGKSERTSTDKKRERRKKKIKQKLKFKKIAEKEKEKDFTAEHDKNISQKLLQKITKNSNITQLDQSEGKYVKSSKAFFSKLQEETSTPIKKKSNLNNSKFSKKTKRR